MAVDSKQTFFLLFHNCLSAAWLQAEIYQGFLLSVSHLESDINSFVSCIPGWESKARNFSVIRTQVQAYKPYSSVMQEWTPVSLRTHSGFLPTPATAQFNPVSHFPCKVLSGYCCFGQDKSP